MKMLKSNRVFGVLIMIGLLVSNCSDVQFNNPAFQADVNYELWRATSFSAKYDPTGNLVITGTNNFETVILTLTSASVGVRSLGPDNSSRAEYIDGFGTTFSTAVEPDEDVSVYRDLGQVEITSRNESNNTFTGTFFFEAFDPDGQNPQALSNGIFFEVQLKEDQ